MDSFAYSSWFHINPSGIFVARYGGHRLHHEKKTYHIALYDVRQWNQELRKQTKYSKMLYRNEAYKVGWLNVMQCRAIKKIPTGVCLYLCHNFSHLKQNSNHHAPQKFKACLVLLTNKSYLMNHDWIISRTVKDVIPQWLQVITYGKYSIKTNGIRFRIAAWQPQREDLHHLLRSAKSKGWFSWKKGRLHINC